MSNSKAINWLQNHSDTIPAIHQTHNEIIELLEQGNRSQDIVSFTASDPGLSLEILKKVNANRGASTGREIVSSTQSGIALLGDQVTYTLLKEFSVAKNILDKPYQLFLFRQIINRSYHNEVQVAEWADENGYPHIDQLKACALLTYSGEVLCCVYDFDNYLKYIRSGSLSGEEVRYFGFSFSQLTEALCQKFNLPEIIINSQPHKNTEDQKEKLLFFIAKLCHQSEHGWYTEIQQENFQQFADFLQQPVDTVISKFHLFSVIAANKSIIPDAWQAASRLILIKDEAWTPPPGGTAEPVKKLHSAQPQTVKTTATENTIKPDNSQQASATHKVNEIQSSNVENDVFNRLKQLLKKPQTSQSEILNCCLNGLAKDFSLNKVSLLLLSKNKQKLQNRMSVGLEKENPFKQYQIDVAKAGLLKILLNKPQAIWVNKSNLKKYEHIIPKSLIASIMTSNFLAMSLFIGEKPIGIIYADRSETTIPIDDKDFTQFKQLISLTGKALTFLAKR